MDSNSSQNLTLSPDSGIKSEGAEKLINLEELTVVDPSRLSKGLPKFKKLPLVIPASSLKEMNDLKCTQLEEIDISAEYSKIEPQTIPIL